MAVRAPTTFNKYIDDSALRPLDNIEFTEPEKILDDQEFALRKNELLISDCFMPAQCWQAARHEVGRYYIAGPDMCNYDAAVTTTNCQAAILSASERAVNYDVHIYNATRTTRYTYNITANHNTWLWRGWFTVVIDNDGTENELIIELTAPDYPFPAYIAGVALFTNM